MRQLIGICIMVLFAAAYAQGPVTPEMKSTKLMKLTEIRQVMRENDPSGKEHNIKMMLDAPSNLPNVQEWQLLLYKNGRDTVYYTSKADGSNPSTQTEILFEGNLIESDSIILNARNSSQVVAYYYGVMDIQDLDSEVAWVGDTRSGDSSSLRVKAGNLLKEVIVDRDVCETADSPCYYITPKPKPTTFDRCYYPIEGVKQCDDRVTSFKVPSELPGVFLVDDSNLELEFTFNKEKVIVEVLAYNPQDHTQIYSPYPYGCRFPVGKIWQEGEKMRCRQKLELPEGHEEMMILVVRLGEHGRVLESSLLYHGDNYPPNPPDSNTGVIVGAVFGSLIGLAIIICLVIFCIKKNDEKKSKTTRGGSAVYAPTTTTDPAEA